MFIQVLSYELHTIKLKPNKANKLDHRTVSGVYLRKGTQTPRSMSSCSRALLELPSRDTTTSSLRTVKVLVTAPDVAAPFAVPAAAILETLRAEFRLNEAEDRERRRLRFLRRESYVLDGNWTWLQEASSMDGSELEFVL